MSEGQKYLLVILLFLISRLIVHAGYEYRQAIWLYADSDGYVASARYIEEHGHVSADQTQKNRQFAGLSLLLIPVDFVTGNLLVAGYLVVGLSSIGVLVLTQYLFQDFRLSCVSAIFMPYWVATTAVVMSEAPTIMCLLLALVALRKFSPGSVLFWILILLAGYSAVLRQTAVFSLFPFLVVYSALRYRMNLLLIGAICLIASLPLITYLSWNWLSIHQLFPQYGPQRDFMNILVDASPHPERYHRVLLDQPFYSIWAGLTDPGENLFKKAFLLSSLFIGIAALVALPIRARLAKPEDAMMFWAFFGALAVHFFFHVCVGGTFGYSGFDRYISQLNPIICVALFLGVSLRWPWIFMLGLLSMLAAVNVGWGGQRFLIH